MGFLISMTIKNVSGAQDPYYRTFQYLFDLQLWISIFLLVALLITSFYLMIKYRASNTESKHVKNKFHSSNLEILWTVLATILALWLFFLTIGPVTTFAKANNKHADVIVKVRGYQFYWNITVGDQPWVTGVNFTTGAYNKIVFDHTKTYLLEITADVAGVIHSFYVPKLGFKADAVPGHTNYVYLSNLVPGVYDVTCAEFCGAGHYNMPARITVI